MKLEPCIGCGRMVLTHSVANLTVKCEPTPLDGQGVAQELGAGRQIWTPEFGPGLIPKRLRAARPGDTKLLREHRCTAAGALSTPSPVPGASQSPKGRETGVQSFAAPSTPSSARPTVPSGVPAAASRTSDCSLCGHPIELADVENYVMIELGATVIDAFHVGGCPAG